MKPTLKGLGVQQRRIHPAISDLEILKTFFLLFQRYPASSALRRNTLGRDVRHYETNPDALPRGYRNRASRRGTPWSRAHALRVASPAVSIV